MIRTAARAMTIVVALVGLGDAATASGAPPTGTKDRAAIESAIQRYAGLIKANDAVGVSRFFAANGELLEPGMSALAGPEAVRTFLESFKNVRVQSATMTTDSIEVFGASAIQWGQYTERAALPDKPAIDLHGRFVAQWVRVPAGGWQIRRLLMQPAL